MDLELEQLSSRIIGATTAVHHDLGSGFLESVYENAPAIELELWEVSFQRQYLIPVEYRGIEVGHHRLDLFAMPADKGTAVSSRAQCPPIRAVPQGEVQRPGPS